ncbi:hypothetical protein BDY21DRAFT_17132 [Lineolata rhizophorae]|uniref:Uncharacterized protein n=1 Tax=Lineolata rhizophorae TaxID=578093 RepID=A0A6A6P252_9PEZI|nr:hypothetical protein BDY21DRAFT_17132 [Lineolata rhizophorae]
MRDNSRRHAAGNGGKERQVMAAMAAMAAHRLLCYCWAANLACALRSADHCVCACVCGDHRVGVLSCLGLMLSHWAGLHSLLLLLLRATPIAPPPLGRKRGSQVSAEHDGRRPEGKHESKPKKEFPSLISAMKAGLTLTCPRTHTLSLLLLLLGEQGWLRRILIASAAWGLAACCFLVLGPFLVEDMPSGQWQCRGSNWR